MALHVEICTICLKYSFISKEHKILACSKTKLFKKKKKKSDIYSKIPI